MAKHDPRDYRWIKDLVLDEEWNAVQTALSDLHPADIADILNGVPRENLSRLFALLDENVKPDVLAELESVAGKGILKSLSNTELSEIVEEMAPDDAADVLGDLSEERSRQVLDLMEHDESKEVRRLLTYDDETAGGIMTTDIVSMHEHQTVGEALDAIASLDTHEPFYQVHIVDTNSKLVGFVRVWDLLKERDRSRPIGELAQKQLGFATVDTDQEEVARIMGKYDLTVLPVVDAKGILVGRITADDVLEVMEEEASEDIFRLAGSDDAELETTSALKSCIVRLPWLLITLGGGFLTSLILRNFHLHVHNIIVLAAFVPVILAMGGNTGIQSSTLIVRSIALGSLKGQNVVKMLLRELTAGAMMGAVCGTVIAIWSHHVIATTPGHDGASPVQLAAIVATALFSAMTFAACFGAAVPLVLSRLKVDPAVAAGPFVSITNDISALLIYFGVTVGLLQTFVQP